MAHKPPPAELVPAATPASPKDLAKQLFMDRKSRADISRVAGVTPRQIQRWCDDEQWADQREVLERSLIEDGFSTRKLTVSKIATLSVEQLHRGIQHLANRVENPSISEMEKLSVIISNLDRLSRLDTGRSTDNHAIQANVKLSIEDIKAIVNADPFGKTEE